MKVDALCIFPCTWKSANSTCNCGVAQRQQTGIVNGVVTEVNEYPWMVYLDGPFYCGGSVISPHHVLTAAHCTTGTSPSEWNAVIGEIQTISVAEILNRFTEAADLAILTLASPISFSATAAPVCLPASVSPLYTGEVATVAGWGDTTQGGSGSPTLMEANLTVISNSQCSNAYVKDGLYNIDTIDRFVCLTLDLDLH